MTTIDHGLPHPVALLLSIALLSCTASGKPFQTAEWVGSNYTPAYCVNAVELWHDFRPEVIDSELAAAGEYFGLTTLRVYLNNIPYDAEKETFLARIEEFLVICDRHGIRPGFTFLLTTAGIMRALPSNRRRRSRGATTDVGPPARKTWNEPRRICPSFKRISRT